jgi:Flp pilus assembly pilin Flp
METVGNILRRFVRDENGLETVEYAIIAGLIVAGTVLTITAIGVWVKAQFDGLKTDLGA